VVVAHISDLHVRRRGTLLHHIPHVAGPLRRTLATIQALPERPACILATGDLTENGTHAEYLRLRGLLDACDLPVYLLAGNHDDRDALRAAFPDHRYLHRGERAVQFTVEWDRLRIVAIDSSEPPYRQGYLGADGLAWLARTLSDRPGTPTIVALHHPPFPTGVRAFDRLPFEGRDAFARIVRAHPNVGRIVSGHVHQTLCREWAGTIAVTAPSTAPTLVLPPRGALRWEPGGFLLHRLAGSAIETERVRIASEPAEPVAIGA